MRRRYGIQRLCQKRLQDGTKSDAIFRMVIICILLLRAWVVQGNFRNSRLCFVSLYTGYGNVAFEFIRAADTTAYNQITTCRGLTLNEKMRLATVFLLLMMYVM